MNYKKYIYIHIDDFGFNKEVNKQIASYVKNFKLIKGISIFAHPKANFSYINELKRIDLSLHLNLTSFQKKKFNFFKLIFISIFPSFFSKEIKIIEQMIKYQIDRFLNMKLKKEKIMKIDGHNHVHIIPIVNRICIKYLKKKKINFIFRNNNEYFFLYMNRFFFSILLNYIKLLIIKILFKSLSNKRKYFSNNSFIGVICSGFYNYKSFKFFLKKNIKLNKNKKIEFLIHPFKINNKKNKKYSSEYKYYLSNSRRHEIALIQFLQQNN